MDNRFILGLSVKELAIGDMIMVNRLDSWDVNLHVMVFDLGTVSGKCKSCR